MKRILLLIAVCLLVTSCNHFKQIVEKPVYIHDTTFRYIRDSVKVIDSIFTEKETIIREADSATLAEFGIKLKDSEKAILLLQRELVERIRDIEKMRSDSTDHSKEIPVEVTTTEIKEVEKPLKWYQSGFIFVGVVSLVVLIGYIVVKLIRKRI